MADDYTPTTEEVRTAWTHGYHGDNYPDAEGTDAEFDRWLAAHNAAQGEPTDAQVTAALETYWGVKGGFGRSQFEAMRAALRAAAEVEGAVDE